MTCGPDHKSTPDIRLQAGVTTGGKSPLYDHCVRKRMGMRCQDTDFSKKYELGLEEKS